MNTNDVLEFELFTESNITSSMIEELSSQIQDNYPLELMATPLVIRNMNDAPTVLSLIIGLTAGTVPILIEVIFNWMKTKKVRIMEVEVTRGDTRIKVKMNKDDEAEALELVKKISNLVERL